MRKAGVLFLAALAGSTYLCIALTVLGVDKFYYLLAGGKKFATFPDWSEQLGIGLSYLALSLLYLGWLLQAPQMRFTRFSQIATWASPFLLLALLSYPLGNDVYLYLHAGLMNLQGVNPYLVKAGLFTSQLSAFVDWSQTSTYGPISQVLFTLSAIAVPVHGMVAVYLYKILCLCLHFLNGYLVWRLVRSPELSWVALAYLVNPLLLMEQVGSAHVDVLVSTSLLGFAACLGSKRYLAAFGLLWGGFLSKTIPLIWMPLVGLFLIKQGQWRSLGKIVLFTVGLGGLLWFTVLPNLEAWKSLLNPGVEGQYQSSIHASARSALGLVRLFWPESLTRMQETQWLTQLEHYTFALFAGFYGWATWRLIRQQPYANENLLEDMGWVTLVLLLIGTAWVMPWYASVLLTFAAIIPRASLLGLTSLAFGLSSSAQYLLYGYPGMKGVVSIGLPLLVLLAAAITLLPSRTPETAR